MILEIESFLGEWLEELYKFSLFNAIFTCIFDIALRGIDNDSFVFEVFTDLLC